MKGAWQTLERLFVRVKTFVVLYSDIVYKCIYIYMICTMYNIHLLKTSDLPFCLTILPSNAGEAAEARQDGQAQLLGHGPPSGNEKKNVSSTKVTVSFCHSLIQFG